MAQDGSDVCVWSNQLWREPHCNNIYDENDDSYDNDENNNSQHVLSAYCAVLSALHVEFLYFTWHFYDVRAVIISLTL